MFTQSELQFIEKTLSSRREWLQKNIDKPDAVAQKTQNKEILAFIENLLAKITSQLKLQAADVATSAPLSIKQKRQQMPAEKIKVLIADDDYLLASLLEAILHAAGITQVDIADDGVKAVNMIYNATPVYDLVLCDWYMPLKSGLDVHNAMRAADRCADACFMLVTGVTEAKQIRSAIEVGVNDYTVKPIENEKLLKKIARHFPRVDIEAALLQLESQSPTKLDPEPDLESNPEPESKSEASAG
ncbi:MAG TPA: response regulator [Cellvibrio sp.]|nr:response regulator [Cellvibrio sp.]